jgi:hypothetical protein
MSLENMKARIRYQGGNQQERMNVDKLKSLRKALIDSYQGATAKLADGREFRCLINRNKLSLDLDDKIISIPFEDICLNADEVRTTAEGMVEIGMKEGHVFEWKENGSHWIVFLRRLEETAYFRADIRRCRYEITLNNGHKYWGYVRGPVEQQILWSQSSGNYYNKLNYTLIMYLPQNEETLDYFHRFSKVTVGGRPWEVQAIDDLSTPGLIQVHLKETFSNTIETDVDKAVKESINVDVVDKKEETYIHGPSEVYPYDVKTYEIKNYQWKAGIWFVEDESRLGMIKLTDISDNKVTVNVLTGRSGSFTLAYKTEDQVIAALNITVESL